MDISEERETKRRKVSSNDNEVKKASVPNPIVTIQIANHPVLKQFIEVLEKILDTVKFFLVYKTADDDFSGLRVQTMNTAKTCMIQARFQTPLPEEVATLPDEEKSFALHAESFANVLDIAEANEVVTMSVYQDKVWMDISQPNGSSHGVNLFLPRVDYHEDVYNIRPMHFRYTVQFKQTLFKKQMKTYKKFDVEKLDFCLYKRKQETPTKQDDTEQFYFAFRGFYGGPDTIDNWYLSPITSEKINNEENHSRLKGDTQLSVDANDELSYFCQDGHDGLDPSPAKVKELIQATPNLENMEEVYRETFNRSLLEHFTKGFEKFDLKIYIDKEMPLILHYPVGASSYIRFILMMLGNDDDDDEEQEEVTQGPL